VTQLKIPALPLARDSSPLSGLHDKGKRRREKRKRIRRPGIQGEECKQFARHYIHRWGMTKDACTRVDKIEDFAIRLTVKKMRVIFISKTLIGALNMANLTVVVH